MSIVIPVYFVLRKKEHYHISFLTLYEWKTKEDVEVDDDFGMPFNVEEITDRRKVKLYLKGYIL